MGCGAGAESYKVIPAPEAAARHPGHDGRDGSPRPHKASRRLEAASASGSALREKLEDQELAWELQQSLRAAGQAGRRLSAELKGVLEGLASPSAPSGSSSGAARDPGGAGAGPAIFAAPRGAESLLEWDARLPGPKGTPYEGGVFFLSLRFPAEYPMRPPSAVFVTPIFHPNVDADNGKICLNILKEEWNPLLTVSTTLLCLSALLAEPGIEDPLNLEAAHIMRQSPSDFRRVAREWTRKYAARSF